MPLYFTLLQMLKSLFFTILIVTPFLLWSQQSIKVEGTVYLDKNKNQTFDTKERGLKNIPISNGKDIVYTDSKGHFSIAIEKGQSVFPILPSGYAISRKETDKVSNSYFFYPEITPSLQKTLIHHFGLFVEKQPSQFRIGAIGDIQVGDTDEINYAGKSIFRELGSRYDLAFNLMLGDMVNDRLFLLAPFKDMLNSLPSPSWTVLGNHDRNSDSSSTAFDQSYNQVFGASNYAFNYGNKHFIILNNVFSTGKRSYEGRVSEDQLQFLKNDLKAIPTNTQIVICQHIPMLYTRNRNEVLSILEPFSNVLILSGHTHQVNRCFYNQGRVQEIITGAPSGNWWTGETNREGIPDALMQCGSPRNYFIIDFNKSNYNLHFKAIGLDSNQQTDISLRGDTVIANLYAASDSTLVQIQIDEAEWLTMEKVKRPAESVLRVIENNQGKRFPASGSRINPLRKRNSPHIWQTEIGPLLPGTHRLRIKAYDRFGYSIETLETIYISE